MDHDVSIPEIAAEKVGDQPEEDENQSDEARDL